MKKHLFAKAAALLLTLCLAAGSLSGCITTGILTGIAAVDAITGNHEESFTVEWETETETEEEPEPETSVTEAETETEPASETAEPTEEETAEEETTAEVSDEECAAFLEFTNRVLGEMLSDSTINLHYFLAHPEDFGVVDPEVTWGSFDVSDEALQEYEDQIEGYIDELAEFDYDALDWEGKLTFDAFEWFLNTEKEGFGLDLMYEPLGPNAGEQAMLPVDLAEYNFYEEEDIDVYLELLRLVPDYFDDILEFEKLRAEKGIFMEDDVLENTLSQIEDFVDGKKDSFLLSTFEERLDELGIKGSKKDDYMEANEDAVMNYFYPAYEALYDGLSELKGSNEYEGGLCNYPGGDEYYAYLLKARTGSEKTPQEMIDMLDDGIESAINTVTMLLSQDMDLYDYFDNTPYPSNDPNLCLRILEEEILKDFPEIPDVDYSVKYVDASLRDYLSPACYMIPPVDGDVKNSILINCDRGDEDEDIFITLAHEGYPGHLYQTNYFHNNAQYKLRSIIGTSGFTEGYATYVENASFHYIDELSDDAAEFLRANAQISLYIYARVDLGFHYEGWDLDDAAEYLDAYFEGADEVAEWMYDYMRGDPGVYENYAIGELEILDIENEARDADDFNLKAFHKDLLDCSEAPFSVIREYVLK